MVNPQPLAACREGAPWRVMRWPRARSLTLGVLFSLAGAGVRAQSVPPRESVLDRFLRYVRLDTRSLEDQGHTPSTEGQRTFARMLVGELRALGVRDVSMDSLGIVYAHVPGNLPPGRDVPAVGFVAHLDTSPFESGTDVRPIVHRNYQGGDLVLPADTTRVLRVAEDRWLAQAIGDDIVTADGRTLLGSDDKAGIAELMTLVDLLARNPSVAHGPIAIAFLPDEEIGSAAERLDLARFGARFAYTVDGGPLGSINDETFSGRVANVTFAGRDGAPIKDWLVNAAYAAADFIGRIPPAVRPEHVDGRDGYIHPYAGAIGVGTSTVKLRLRSFTIAGLDSQEVLVRRLVEDARQRFPSVQVTAKVEHLFTNMKDSLRLYPEIVGHAIEATRRAGIAPSVTPIRGGTDGSDLTARGVPTPDLFTGGHNFHTRLEWNSRRGLEQTVAVLVQLVTLIAERPPRR